MRVIIPLHITGFWYVVRSYHPLLTGSLGAGLTLDPPVIASVDEGTSSYCRLLLNGRCVDYPTVETASRLSGLNNHVTVRASSKAFLGEGYGMSAALVLAYLAINLYRVRRTTWNHVASVAHMAEVLNETGYGDVIAEVYGGGLVVRTSVGPPGIGMVDVVPASNALRVVTVPLGTLTTRDMMKNYGAFIDKVGSEVYRRFIESPSVDSFVGLAYEFSTRVGMMSRETDRLLRTELHSYLSNGCILGYFVKKRLLSIVCEESCLDDVVSILSRHFDSIRVFSIAKHGSLVM